MRSVIRFTFVVFAAALVAAAQNKANEVCAGCHDKGQKMAGTVHASLACSQCHPKHEDYPHPANIPKPVCAGCHTQAAADYSKGVHGQAVAKGNSGAPECSTCHNSAHEVLDPQSVSFRKAIPDTCGMCHSDIADQYKSSVHGAAVSRGELNAAVCTDCHGEHLILTKKNESSPVNSLHQRETCGQCHGNVALARRFGLPTDRLTTFDASFHGLAAKGGSQTVAGCASCHGIHNILPPSDPKSAVNPKNLPATCGKCHPGAGTRFALGPIHVSEAKQSAAADWVRAFYLFTIPFTIGFMLLHNAGDWIRKVVRFYRGGPASRAITPSGEIRMYSYERLSHALLASSFIVLAWTGLALKFPDHWWAAPLLLGEPNMHIRRNVHRVAAVIMMAVSLMHLFSLIFNRPLREHWLEMLPKYQDALDALKGMLYNLGLRSEKPRLPHHSYVEKAEYWAVVWGTMVMVVTGVLLWANNWSLEFLPKWVLDVCTSVHWYEAVLASLAIVVWHFYSVIFDPDVYPLDTAFLTGRSPRRRDEAGEHESSGEPVPEHAHGD
jgi:cytochrome b subunit of formate dehydrogenase